MEHEQSSGLASMDRFCYFGNRLWLFRASIFWWCEWRLFSYMGALVMMYCVAAEYQVYATIMAFTIVTGRWWLRATFLDFHVTCENRRAIDKAKRRRFITLNCLLSPVLHHSKLGDGWIYIQMICWWCFEVKMLWFRLLHTTRSLMSAVVDWYPLGTWIKLTKSYFRYNYVVPIRIKRFCSCGVP